MLNVLTYAFEEYAQNHKNLEFWYARDLEKLLEYKRWDKFTNVIEKAMISFKNASEEISDHFAHVRKTISMPKGPPKRIDDYFMLPRYTC